MLRTSSDMLFALKHNRPVWQHEKTCSYLENTEKVVAVVTVVAAFLLQKNTLAHTLITFYELHTMNINSLEHSLNFKKYISRVYI